MTLDSYPIQTLAELMARYRRCPVCSQLQPPGAMRIFKPDDRPFSIRRQCIFCKHWADGALFGKEWP